MTDTQELNRRLLQAAQIGDTAAVRDLLAEGANVNAVNEIGATPLMCAAGVAKTETVRALLAAGADVNIRNSLGNSALYLAQVARDLGELEGAREVIALLVNAGAK